MFNTVLNSLEREKKIAKANPRFFDARSSQRHRNREEFQGLAQGPFCKCTSGTKDQCSFQGRAGSRFPAFFFKSLGPCQKQTYTSPGRKNLIQRGLQEFDYWGGGAPRHVPRQPAPNVQICLKAVLMVAPDRQELVGRSEIPRMLPERQHPGQHTVPPERAEALASFLRGDSCPAHLKTQKQ